MGTFGERLQREREMRGIALEEIAEATKIGTRFLRALEEQDFKKLPGGIFNKGFVRSYARYLGIDEDEAVADYEAAIGEIRPAGEDEEAAAEDEPSPEPKPRARFAFTGSLALVALAALVYAGWTFYARRPVASPNTNAGAETQPVPARSSGSARSAPASQPPGTASGAAPASSGAQSRQAVAPKPPEGTANGALPPAAEFEVLLRATQDSWISVTIDDQNPIQQMLTAGTEKSFRGHGQMVIKLGNPAGVEVLHNGKPVLSAGEPGRTRTVRFTAQGLQ